MRNIKVLLVDDSAFMRLLISDILSEDESLEVVGAAVNGKEAAEKVGELQPDLVLLDMNMGEYDGIYAVKRIMKENPLPILILSAVGNTNLEPIFDALKLGAVDYMNKPSRGNAKMRTMNIELIHKIKSVARAEPKILKNPIVPKRPAKRKREKAGKYDLIVIGASTGGPTAIEKVISTLPGDLAVPVVIVQHMPANFIRPFVQRLNTISELNVVLGAKNMPLYPGNIIVAPGDANMILKSEGDEPVIDFNHEKFREYNNPSINALMLSVAEVKGGKAIGVILTGMGKDGVKGLKAMKDKGALTVAQSQESCVIYGMPKVAVENDAISEVLHLKDIGNFLVNSL